jgi:hypothetical protein
MKNEVSNAIGALITTWQSVQRALLRHREQKQGGNGVDPKQSADSRREEFAADE